MPNNHDDVRQDIIAIAAREALSMADGDVHIAAAIMASATASNSSLRQALTGSFLAQACRIAVESAAGPVAGG